MGEPVGLTGEQSLWLTLLREIEHELAQGFKGDIILHCRGDGTVESYHLSQFRKPGEKRQLYERRLAGPREAGDRRKPGG